MMRLRSAQTRMPRHYRGGTARCKARRKSPRCPTWKSQGVPIPVFSAKSVEIIDYKIVGVAFGATKMVQLVQRVRNSMNHNRLLDAYRPSRAQMRAGD